MAKRLDTSSVSQEEVEALFTDHDLFGENGEKSGETETQDDEENSTGDEEEAEGQEEEEQAEADEDSEEEESEEQEEEGEEEESEESESEEDDEDEEESEAQSLDWSKVSPKHKAAFDEAESRARKFERAHAKLQSQLTRDSKTRQQEEATLTTLRAKAEAADKWDALLHKHPELQETLEAAIAKIRDPFKDVPDFLREDPIFQQMQRYNQRLEERLAKFEENFAPIKEIQTERQTAQNRQRVDGLLGEAGAKFKTMFGRDPNQQEKTAILKHMVDNKYYPDAGQGHLITLEVFGSQWEKHLKTDRNKQLRDKAKKFGARNKALNTARTTVKKHADSPEEAVAMALAEQGYGT